MPTEDTSPYGYIGHWDHTSGKDYLKKHHKWTDRFLESASGLKGKELSNAQIYARKLSTRFYVTSNLSGVEIIREVTGYGRAETVTKSRLLSYQRQVYGKGIEPELGQLASVLQLLPVVNSSLYYPAAMSLVAINNGVYFNTYQPPLYAPQSPVVKGITAYAQRPKVWQQFLTRWFPNDCPSSGFLEPMAA